MVICCPVRTTVRLSPRALHRSNPGSPCTSTAPLTTTDHWTLPKCCNLTEHLSVFQSTPASPGKNNNLSPRIWSPFLLTTKIHHPTKLVHTLLLKTLTLPYSRLFRPLFHIISSINTYLHRYYSNISPYLKTSHFSC